MGEKPDTGTLACRILQMLRRTQKRFTKGLRSFFGPGKEEKWHGTHTYKPHGLWKHAADDDD